MEKHTLQVEIFDDRIIVHGGSFEDVMAVFDLPTQMVFNNVVTRLINDDNTLSYEIQKDNYDKNIVYHNGKLNKFTTFLRTRGSE